MATFASGRANTKRRPLRDTPVVQADEGDDRWLTIKNTRARAAKGRRWWRRRTPISIGCASRDATLMMLTGGGVIGGGILRAR